MVPHSNAVPALWRIRRMTNSRHPGLLEPQAPPSNNSVERTAGRSPARWVALVNRISSRATFFTKRVFPTVWFGFLALIFVTGIVGTSAWCRRAGAVLDCPGRYGCVWILLHEEPCVRLGRRGLGCGLRAVGQEQTPSGP